MRIDLSEELEDLSSIEFDDYPAQEREHRYDRIVALTEDALYNIFDALIDGDLQEFEFEMVRAMLISKLTESALLDVATHCHSVQMAKRIKSTSPPPPSE